MKENRPSSWNFLTDDVHSYAWWDNFLTKDECKSIIKIGNKHKSFPGTIRKEHAKDTQVRDSNINFLYPNGETEWLFRRLTDIIMNLNERYFKFDIHALTEGLQFSHYKAPGGKYTRHVDVGYGFQVRKLSITVQLSDPKTYKGGDLLIYQGEEPTKMIKDQGALAIFPSYTLHEVTPVTKNERYSLVCWVNGKQFK